MAFPTTQLESLLRAAYSQNYVYLIKQADDQYEVIVEADDAARTGPEDFRQIYVKPDNGDKLIPIRALTRTKETLGLQSVNHINQFTSVTFGFDTKPDVALGDVTNFINKTAAEVLPPTVKGELQGEGLVLQQLFQALPFLVIAAVFVMYVILGILYESYVHPVTVLSTLFPAVVGGLDDALDFRLDAFALFRDRALSSHGHREEKRHHDCRFRAPSTG